MKVNLITVKVSDGVATWPTDFATSELTIKGINKGPRGFIVRASLAEGGRDILLSEDHISDLLTSFGKAKVGDAHDVKVSDTFKNVMCSNGIIAKAV